MPPKRASSTKSTAAKSTPSKPARPATTAKAAASAGKGKATAAKARAKPKPKPVTKLAPEYPSSTPRRSSRQGPKRAGSGEAVVPSKKAKLPPDQGDNRTGSVVDSLGAYNQAHANKSAPRLGVAERNVGAHVLKRTVLLYRAFGVCNRAILLLFL